MKNNIIYIAVAMILLAGCRHKEPPVEGFAITPQEISCDHLGGEFSVAMVCSDSWEAKESPSWVEVIKIDEISANVIINENHSSERSGKVKFSTSKANAELTIIQSGSDKFSINCKSKEINHLGGIFTIKISSYRQWKATSDSHWISTAKKSSEGTKEIRVHIKPNRTTKERNGNLFFIQDTDTLKVEIKQLAYPFIEIVRETVSVDGDGGTFDILFLSNYKVDVTCDQEWIRIINLSSSNVISFEVLRNMDDYREGTVKITTEADENIYRTITVKQGPKIPHPNLRFEEGSELNVTDNAGFKLHPIFEEMTDYKLVWFSSNQDIASVDNGGNVCVHKTGQCTITAKNNFHDTEAKIVLDIKLRAENVNIMFGNQDMMTVPVSSRLTGEKIPVIVTLTPEGSYAEDFIFYSSNPEVAEFENNILHCHKSGKTDIHIESSFNNFKYSFSVYVIDIEK